MLVAPMDIVTNALTGLLVSLYTLTGNLGITIIGFAILVRTLMLPLTLPSLKMQKEIQKLQPELKKLKEKHKGNQQGFAQAQMELYKKYNVNPLAGCLPQILQLGLVIFLYHVFTRFLSQDVVNGVTLNHSFLWLDLRGKDQFFIVPILAGVTQLIYSLMIAPAAEVKDEVPNTSKKKKVQEANKKEEDVAEMGQMMQQQMIFLLPAMTTVFALQFPAGLGLYWAATTIVSIIQQYFISGPGGLVTYSRRAVLAVRKVINRS